MKEVIACTLSGAVVNFAHKWAKKEFTKGDVIVLESETNADAGGFHGTQGYYRNMTSGITIGSVLEVPNEEFLKSAAMLDRDNVPVDCRIYAVFGTVHMGGSLNFDTCIVDGRRFRKATAQEIMEIDRAVAELLRINQNSQKVMREAAPVGIYQMLLANGNLVSCLKH